MKRSEELRDLNLARGLVSINSKWIRGSGNESNRAKTEGRIAGGKLEDLYHRF